MVQAPEAAKESLVPSLPGPADCKQELDRILSNSEFDATDRERRFLAYVVEETLASRGDRIKAYSIAVSVFGRGELFNPQTDPIVRVEAGHLRRALQRYYFASGRDDPLVIAIPKGSYIPTFVLRTPGVKPEIAEPGPSAVETRSAEPIKLMRNWHWVAAASALAIFAVVALVVTGSAGTFGLIASKPSIPRLLVEPLRDVTATQASAAFATGFTQEVIGQIAKFKDIVVVEQGAPGLAPTMAEVEARYALAGSVEFSGESLRLQARILSRSDGSVLWANSYSGDLKVAQVLQIEGDIAQQVATALAQSYGVIFQADAVQHVENPPDNWQAYACTLAYYGYRVDFDVKKHPKVRKCLEDAVAQFPAYATAWALLSMTYVDEFRFQYPADSSSVGAPIDRALVAARRAVAIDPQNVRALEFEMLALLFSGDIPAALKIGERGLAINPNDTELAEEYGIRLALSGDWSRGCALVEQAADRNSSSIPDYETNLAICAYFGGDPDRAAIWIKKRAANQSYYHLIAAAIFGDTGAQADAARERDWLLKNAPDLVHNIRHELSLRVTRSEDIDRFIGSLGKAGLPVKE